MPYSDPRPTCVFDSECYHAYYALGFKSLDGTKKRLIERTPERELDRDAVRLLIANWRIVTFNGIHYDLPMLMIAMTGASNEELKRASDTIIQEGLKPWEALDRWGVQLPAVLDHIDLIEVAKGRASLKIYGGRVHTRRMQDLPFPITYWLDQEADRDIVRRYLINDLDCTIDLYNYLRPKIALREQISDRYGQDWRSKSEPQMAEALIRHEIERITQKKVYRPDAVPATFFYRPPPFIDFETPALQGTLATIEGTRFVVGPTGAVELPETILPVEIAGDVYRMGIGGLHSSEKKRTLYSDEDVAIIDRDVASMYPSIILLMGLYPAHLGRVFLDVYRELYDSRLASKRSLSRLPKGSPEWQAAFADSEVKKLAMNGTFGKLASRFSFLYSPDNMIAVTLTGQLSLLMLIERLSLHGFKVISANTDGVTTLVERERKWLFDAICLDWEFDTGMLTEETEYLSLHSRDVNNYIAIKDGNSVKLKGAYAGEAIDKNPTNQVAIDAAVAAIADGTPVERTVRECRDIRKFLTVRTVNGGCVDAYGNEVGKAIRYYISDFSPGALTYKTTGNKVPKTDGAELMMELIPGYFPDDVNYEYYVREAEAILQEIGFRNRDPSIALLKGESYARLPTQKTVHVVDVPTGTTRCGKASPSIRLAWILIDTPRGRVCRKCSETLAGARPSYTRVDACAEI